MPAARDYQSGSLGSRRVDFDLNSARLFAILCADSYSLLSDLGGECRTQAAELPLMEELELTSNNSTAQTGTTSTVYYST